METDGNLYERVTTLRSEAFELIAQLEHSGEAHGAHAPALVLMQGVANALGRVQGELAGGERVEAQGRPPRAGLLDAFSDPAGASAIR